MILTVAAEVAALIVFSAVFKMSMDKASTEQIDEQIDVMVSTDAVKKVSEVEQVLGGEVPDDAKRLGAGGKVVAIMKVPVDEKMDEKVGEKVDEKVEEKVEEKVDEMVNGNTNVAVTLLNIS